jgi:hypothetical protein
MRVAGLAFGSEAVEAKLQALVDASNDFFIRNEAINVARQQGGLIQDDQRAEWQAARDSAHTAFDGLARTIREELANL